MRLPYQTGIVRVSSPYGSRVLNGASEWHAGIDLVGSSKTIVAVAGGTVLQSRMVTDKTNRTWEWGNYVSVAGDDGKIMYYCHMASRAVKQGQRVEVGDVLGVEGSTGYSFGSHCHFEVRLNDNKTTVNAADYLGIDNTVGVSYTVNAAKEGENLKEEKKTEAKTDSEPDSWAKEAVEWAVKNGVIYGDGNGNLMLRESCTREQMLVFLYRALAAAESGQKD